MNSDNIRRVLKEKRQEKGLSAEKLGKIVGVDKTTIYRYEKGQIKKMPFNVLNKLADTLEINPAFISGFSDSPIIGSPDDDTKNAWSFQKNQRANTKKVTPEDVMVENISSVTRQLELSAQVEVFDFAQKKLEKQKEKIVSMPKKREVGDFAAHSDDPNKKVTEEEKERIHDFLDYLDEKHDKNK